MGQTDFYLFYFFHCTDRIGICRLQFKNIYTFTSSLFINFVIIRLENLCLAVSVYQSPTIEDDCELMFSFELNRNGMEWNGSLNGCAVLIVNDRMNGFVCV